MAEIRLEQVGKVYDGDVRAVDDVSLTIESGEFMVLVGPSGCGKSTLLRMIAGLEEVTEGDIWIGEREVARLAPRDRDIAMVFQNYALYPHMTVAKNLGYGLKVRHLPSATVRARVGHVLELVGLPGYESRYPNQLSGGEQQRVAVARAVVVEPQLLLFDEPLSNLDAKLRVQMRAELSQLQKRLAITTVYVTHDQEEAMAISDRIAVMRQGRIAQIGTAEDLYRTPRSAFVAQFIGRVNLVESRVLSTANGRIVLALWDGSLSVPSVDAYATGQRVALVLRPESLTLAPESTNAGADEVMTPGVVKSRTFLGEKVEYVVDVRGTPLQAVTYDPARRGLFPPGARVQVACDPAFVRAVPADPA